MHHIIRRTCQLASQQAPRISTQLNGGARRAFSQSNVCQRGSLPQFLEPSSAELGALLSKLNSKVLLPEHLTKEQAQLVYKQENKSRLEAEPIEITLGDVTLPLEHIDRNRDRPNRWHTIREVVELSKTPEDWENVVRMLEGFQDAGVRLQSRRVQKVLRRMNEAGMQHLVLKVLQRPVKTGVRLRDRAVTMIVLSGLQKRAALSAWDASETSKMLRFAEQIIELMEDPEHLGKANPTVDDLRASPFVIAAPLELAAAKAKKHTGGKDADGKVQRYASRLMQALQQRDSIAGFRIRVNEMAEKSKTAASRTNVRFQLEQALFSGVSLWNALKTANQVLGADMPAAEAAQKAEKDMWEILEKGLATHKALRTESTPHFLDATIEACQAL